jgi:hypothetical protein
MSSRFRGQRKTERRKRNILTNEAGTGNSVYFMKGTKGKKVYTAEVISKISVRFDRSI